MTRGDMGRQEKRLERRCEKARRGEERGESRREEWSGVELRDAMETGEGAV